MPATIAARAWNPDAWRSRPIRQVPAYPDQEKLDELQRRLDTVLAESPSRLRPPVDGADIMRIRNLPPGPEVGRIKARLSELIMDGEIAADRAAVLDYLKVHSDL